MIDIPNNIWQITGTNCHSSISKPWLLLEKLVKNCIVGKKTASTKQYFYYPKYTIINKTICSLLAHSSQCTLSVPPVHYG